MRRLIFNATICAVLCVNFACASKHSLGPSSSQNSDALLYEPVNPPARSNSQAQSNDSLVRGPLGNWVGTNGEERITLKFGVNGSLILTNAAGAEAGRWSGGRNTYRISVGDFSGEFVLVDGTTASFTLGDSHIEMRRSGG